MATPVNIFRGKDGQRLLNNLIAPQFKYRLPDGKARGAGSRPIGRTAIPNPSRSDLQGVGLSASRPAVATCASSVDFTPDTPIAPITFPL